MAISIATVPAIPTQKRPAASATPTLPQPGWAPWALTLLLAVTAMLYSWNIGVGGYSDYYATAVKSMTVSWKAFFFGAFDPQATITLDKLAGFLLPQALAARIFGFSPASLALPQIIEGLVTVLASYLVIRKWAGWAAGLAGAVIMASTPLLVSMFSHPMEDSLLTMCTTLAVLAFQHSLDTHKTRYLLLCGAMVGIGFQAKMMQAWLILPALAAVYLTVWTGPLRRRVRDLLLAAGVTVAVSLSWMSAIALVPATERPYIDGSLNNNIFSMVFGYNGFNRFIPGLLPGALGADPGAGPSGTTAITAAAVVSHTPFKFLLPADASQIGWLYPMAVAGIVLGLAQLRAPRTIHGPTPHDPAQGFKSGVLLCVALLVSVGSVLGVMALPHTAYLAALALPLAAMAAIGAKLLWHTFNHATGCVRYALPALVLVQSLWAAWLSLAYPVFLPWFAPSIFVLGAVAAVVLTAAVRKNPATPWKRSRLRFRYFAPGLALCVVFAGPMAWSLSALNPAYAGTANDAHAGPYLASANASQRMSATLNDGNYGIGLASNRAVRETAAAEAAMYRYATARSTKKGYAMATDSWRSAAPLILHGGQRVLPIAGYSSRVPSPTAKEIRNLTASGSLPFIVLTGDGAKSGHTTPHLDAIAQWVHQYCKPVPPSAYLPVTRSGDATGTAATSLFHCPTGPTAG